MSAPTPNSTDSSATPNPTANIRVGNLPMTLRRPLPQRLLGVWAHPDDEAYLSAGLMARVVAAGGRVTVLTATRGEKGTDEPDRYDSDAFGALREGELRASLAVLGVTDVRFLGRRDGECEVGPDEPMVDAIAAVMDELDPDAIVTFGPDGMTNHADHQAVCRWTTEAWARRWDGDAGTVISGPTSAGDLLYATVTNDFAVRNRELHDRLGVFGDFPTGQPCSVTRDRVALGCALTDDELDRKRAALAEHASQTAGLAALMGENVYRTWYRDETFRRPTAIELARAAATAEATTPATDRGPTGPSAPMLELAA
ncbi:MAG: PIG-L family deacetylase [Actinomycetota bacterium]